MYVLPESILLPLLVRNGSANTTNEDDGGRRDTATSLEVALLQRQYYNSNGVEEDLLIGSSLSSTESISWDAALAAASGDINQQSSDIPSDVDEAVLLTRDQVLGNREANTVEYQSVVKDIKQLFKEAEEVDKEHALEEQEREEIRRLESMRVILAEVIHAEETARAQLQRGLMRHYLDFLDAAKNQHAEDKMRIEAAVIHAKLQQARQHSANALGAAAGSTQAVGGGGDEFVSLVKSAHQNKIGHLKALDDLSDTSSSSGDEKEKGSGGGGGMSPERELALKLRKDRRGRDRGRSIDSTPSFSVPIRIRLSKQRGAYASPMGDDLAPPDPDQQQGDAATITYLSFPSFAVESIPAPPPSTKKESPDCVTNNTSSTGRIIDNDDDNDAILALTPTIIIEEEKPPSIVRNLQEEEEEDKNVVRETPATTITTFLQLEDIVIYYGVASPLQVSVPTNNLEMDELPTHTFMHSHTVSMPEGGGGVDGGDGLSLFRRFEDALPMSNLDATEEELDVILEGMDEMAGPTPPGTPTNGLLRVVRSSGGGGGTASSFLDVSYGNGDALDKSGSSNNGMISITDFNNTSNTAADNMLSGSFRGGLTVRQQEEEMYLASILSSSTFDTSFNKKKATGPRSLFSIRRAIQKEQQEAEAVEQQRQMELAREEAERQAQEELERVAAGLAFTSHSTSSNNMLGSGSRSTSASIFPTHQSTTSEAIITLSPTLAPQSSNNTTTTKQPRRTTVRFELESSGRGDDDSDPLIVSSPIRRNTNTPNTAAGRNSSIPNTTSPSPTTNVLTSSESGTFLPFPSLGGSTTTTKETTTSTTSAETPPPPPPRRTSSLRKPSDGPVSTLAVLMANSSSSAEQLRQQMVAARSAKERAAAQKTIDDAEEKERLARETHGFLRTLAGATPPTALSVSPSSPRGGVGGVDEEGDRAYLGGGSILFDDSTALLDKDLIKSIKRANKRHQRAGGDHPPEKQMFKSTRTRNRTASMEIAADELRDELTARQIVSEFPSHRLIQHFLRFAPLGATVAALMQPTESVVMGSLASKREADKGSKLHWQSPSRLVQPPNSSSSSRMPITLRLRLMQQKGSPRGEAGGDEDRGHSARIGTPSLHYSLVHYGDNKNRYYAIDHTASPPPPVGNDSPLFTGVPTSNPSTNNGTTTNDIIGHQLDSLRSHLASKKLQFEEGDNKSNASSSTAGRSLLQRALDNLRDGSVVPPRPPSGLYTDVDIVRCGPFSPHFLPTSRPRSAAADTNTNNLPRTTSSSSPSAGTRNKESVQRDIAAVRAVRRAPHSFDVCAPISPTYNCESRMTIPLQVAMSAASSGSNSTNVVHAGLSRMGREQTKRMFVATAAHQRPLLTPLVVEGRRRATLSLVDTSLTVNGKTRQHNGKPSTSPSPTTASNVSQRRQQLAPLVVATQPSLPRQLLSTPNRSTATSPSPPPHLSSVYEADDSFICRAYLRPDGRGSAVEQEEGPSKRLHTSKNDTNNNRRQQQEGGQCSTGSAFITDLSGISSIPSTPSQQQLPSGHLHKEVRSSAPTFPPPNNRSQSYPALTTSSTISHNSTISRQETTIMADRVLSIQKEIGKLLQGLRWEALR